MTNPLPQPFTRRYPTDAHYQADALSLAQAGWRVVFVQREPTGAIVATYASTASTALLHPSSVSKRATQDRNAFVIVGSIIGGALVFALLLALLSAAMRSVGASSGGASANVASNGAQATSAAFAASLDATATANAALATATPAIPTQTPSAAERYDAIAQMNCNFLADSVKSHWDATHATVFVTAQVGPQWDMTALHTTVENIVFDCFKGFYTTPAASAVQAVDVTVKGPITDAYGNSSIGVYGEADLERATERPFNWANLDYQQAWSNFIYDSQWERNS